MPRVYTRSSAKATRSARKAPGQDPSPSDSLLVPPTPSIDLQQGERQGFQVRLVQAEAAIGEAETRIAQARADVEAAIARARADALARVDAGVAIGEAGTRIAQARADAEAAIARFRADTAETQAKACAAMRNPQPTLNLDTLDHQPGDSAVNAETWRDRGFPEIVCTIARDLGVAAAAVYEVYIGEFEPLNLLRLDPARGWSVYERQSTVVMDCSSEKIVFKKKVFTTKDYGDTPSPFITAFVNYIVVYCRLFSAQRLDVVSAQLHLLSHIVQQSETSDWGSCLGYAMTRLTAIRDNDVLHLLLVDQNDATGSNVQLEVPAESQQKSRHEIKEVIKESHRDGKIYNCTIEEAYHTTVFKSKSSNQSFPSPQRKLTKPEIQTLASVVGGTIRASAEGLSRSESRESGASPLAIRRGAFVTRPLTAHADEFLDIKHGGGTGLWAFRALRPILPSAEIGLKANAFCDTGKPYACIVLVCRYDLHLGNLLLQLPSPIDGLSVEQLHSRYSELEPATDPSIPSYAVSPLPFNVPKDGTPIGEALLTLCDLGVALRPNEKSQFEAYTPLEPLTFASDIWSLGCVVFELFSNLSLFNGFLTNQDDLTAQQVQILGPMPPAWWKNWEARTKWYDEEGRPLCGSSKSNALKRRIQTCVQDPRLKMRWETLGEDELITLLRSMLAWSTSERLDISEVLGSDWMTQWALPAYQKSLEKQKYLKEEEGLKEEKRLEEERSLEQEKGLREEKVVEEDRRLGEEKSLEQEIDLRS
ncbi:hypothetical protein E4U33_003205 [Claviceps sp. LM78 group G4]|nr:hypothetical protein E4U33_003205 [Claviceps sp. LM78 group G4]